MAVGRPWPVVERTGRSAGNRHRIVGDSVQVCQQVLTQALQFVVGERRVQDDIAQNVQCVLPIRFQGIAGCHRVLTIGMVTEVGAQELQFFGNLDAAPGSGPFCQHACGEASQP